MPHPPIRASFTDDAAGEAMRHRLTRREALAGGVVGLASGAALLHTRAANAATTAAEAPAAEAASAERRGPRDLSGYLRDTADAPWRSKVVPGTAQEKFYENVYRIDPDRPLPPGRPGKPGEPDADYAPVITPNNHTLRCEIRDGVKVFHLVAEEVNHYFDPGLQCFTWGYNGVTNGPTIEAVEGDRVRIYVTNKLPAPTTVHWHGFVIPYGMDGISGLEQPAILPGETFRYEWTIRQFGTFMYHSHHDTMTQEGMGLVGMFIVHPRKELHPELADLPTVDRDFAIMLQTWQVDIGSSRPNPFSMGFNIFTMNAHVFPDTEPLIVRQNQRVRIRFGNLSATHHHPIHLHGYEFAETAVDLYPIPPEQQQMKATELIGVGQTRTIEFVATEEGDWIFHCHMTHHIMNQMGHFPNTVGMDPQLVNQTVQQVLPDYMTMGMAGMNDRTGRPMHPIPPNSIPMKKGDGLWGKISVAGMANIVKVRKTVSDGDLARNADPGWYRSPTEKMALPVAAATAARDGIRI